MRIMHDASDPSQIGPNAQLLAGYIDGRNTGPLWAGHFVRWPNATHVTISADPNSGVLSHVIDCEAGDYDPSTPEGLAEIVAGIQVRRAAGITPTAYCDRAGQAAITRACGAASLWLPLWWLAVPGEDPLAVMAEENVVAAQFVWRTEAPLVDISVAADYWPGVDPPMSPALSDAKLFVDRNAFVFGPKAKLYPAPQMNGHYAYTIEADPGFNPVRFA